jgi:ABC-2 type transport system ATP-binding protein
MRDIEEICDRVLFMHHGRFIAEGTSTEIARQFNEASLENVFIKVARDGEIKEVES